MGAVNDPAAGAVAARAVVVGLLSPAQDVDAVALVGQQAANGLRVVAFVGAAAGGKIVFGRCGQHGYGIEYGLYLGCFVHVGLGHHAVGQALGFGEYVALDPDLVPVGGVGTNGFAAERGLVLASIGALPVPTQAAFGLQLHQPTGPERLENPGTHPLLEPVVDRGGRLQAAR